MSVVTIIRQRQGVIFVALCALFIVAAIALPDNPRFSQPLPLIQKVLLLAVGIVSLTFGVSLSFYFVDSWNKNRIVANKTAYRIWLTLETLVGVPFALATIQLSLMCLWLVFAR